MDHLSRFNRTWRHLNDFFYPFFINVFLFSLGKIKPLSNVTKQRSPWTFGNNRHLGFYIEPRLKIAFWISRLISALISRPHPNHAILIIESGNRDKAW